MINENFLHFKFNVHKVISLSERENFNHVKKLICRTQCKGVEDLNEMDSLMKIIYKVSFHKRKVAEDDLQKTI